MTSFKWRHYHYQNFTKITSQIFFQFGPLPIKISGYASGRVLYSKQIGGVKVFANFIQMSSNTYKLVILCDYALYDVGAERR